MSLTDALERVLSIRYKLHYQCNYSYRTRDTRAAEVCETVRYRRDAANIWSRWIDSVRDTGLWMQIVVYVDRTESYHLLDTNGKIGLSNKHLELIVSCDCFGPDASNLNFTSNLFWTITNESISLAAAVTSESVLPLYSWELRDWTSGEARNTLITGFKKVSCGRRESLTQWLRNLSCKFRESLIETYTKPTKY